MRPVLTIRHDESRSRQRKRSNLFWVQRPGESFAMVTRIDWTCEPIIAFTTRAALALQRYRLLGAVMSDIASTIRALRVRCARVTVEPVH